MQILIKNATINKKMLDKTAGLKKRTVRAIKLGIRKTTKNQILSVNDE